MVPSKVERVMELARLAGIRVAPDEAREVGDRLDSLLRELAALESLDLGGIEPIVIFDDDSEDGG